MVLPPPPEPCYTYAATIRDDRPSENSHFIPCIPGSQRSVKDRVLDFPTGPPPLSHVLLVPYLDLDLEPLWLYKPVVSRPPLVGLQVAVEGKVKVANQRGQQL